MQADRKWIARRIAIAVIAEERRNTYLRINKKLRGERDTPSCDTSGTPRNSGATDAT